LGEGALAASSPEGGAPGAGTQSAGCPLLQQPCRKRDQADPAFLRRFAGRFRPRRCTDRRPSESIRDRSPPSCTPVMTPPKRSRATVFTTCMRAWARISAWRHGQSISPFTAVPIARSRPTRCHISPASSSRTVVHHQRLAPGGEPSPVRGLTAAAGVEGGPGESAPAVSGGDDLPQVADRYGCRHP